MRKMTDWFQPEIKPARQGVYERDYRSVTHVVETSYAYWDGAIFSEGYRTPHLAKANKKYPSRWQRLPWRGLAKKP